MAHYFNIAFVGAGNLAWHLAPELEDHGHKVTLVHSRSKKKASSLIDRLYDARFKKSLDFSQSNADIVFLTVNDSCIEEIASGIILPEYCTLIHTSGTQSMDLLKVSASASYGVFYPLQTFTKGVKMNIKDTPIFLEANSQESMDVLHTLSKGISRNVYGINSLQRGILHLSAVFATNFSNHMLTIGKSLMDKHDMDFQLMEHVLATMFQKAFEIGPENGQTGPAIRRDENTLKKHLKLLKDDPDLMKIYKQISNHIIKTHS